LYGLPLTVTFINPTGFAGNVALPAVAVVADEKLSKFRKNCCQALVGLFVVPSRNSDCG
jgi:hypothetical protein